MKALVYRGPGFKALEERPKPALQAGDDAIVKITKTTICGTDLHILKGDVPTCAPGRILGHEGVGVVDSVGPGVTAFKAGDHVLISCIIVLRQVRLLPARHVFPLPSGGWILGHTIDGTQAEYVRIPHADTSLYQMPAGADEEALVMLSDILPTGFECGVLNGKIAARRDRGDRRRRPDRPRDPADRPVLFAVQDHHDRPGRQPPGGGAALRRHRTPSTAARKAAATVMALTGGRRRHGDRGGGHSRDLRALRGSGGAGRDHRQCRRPWPQGRSASGTAVVAQHHDHHPPGRYGHHPHAAQGGEVAKKLDPTR